MSSQQIDMKERALGIKDKVGVTNVSKKMLNLKEKGRKKGGEREKKNEIQAQEIFDTRKRLNL